jgi:hypothetical protein
MVIEEEADDAWRQVAATHEEADLIRGQYKRRWASSGAIETPHQ